MRTIIAAAVLALTLGVGAGPALADHDYESRDRYGHGSDYGGNEREERYGDNSCKYVCPDFKDSPVQDAFNFGPVICLPGSTCNVDKQRDDRNPRSESGR